MQTNMMMFKHFRSSRKFVLRFAVTSVIVASAILAVAVLTEQVVSAAVPRSVTATASASGSVSVSWTSPTDAVIATDYSYTVRYRVSGSTGSYSVVQTGNGVTSAIINGLDGGTTYEIKVTATPQVGYSRGSEGCSRNDTVSCTASTLSDSPGASITAQEIPEAPSITSATASSGQIEVVFAAGNLNGSTLSQYTATCGSVTGTGSSTPITVTGLSNGIAYTCTVKAGSNQGDSAASASSSAATPSAVPDTLSTPSASAGDAQATITWTPLTATAGSAVDADVADDGGTAVTGYTVSIVNSATGTEVTTLSALSTDNSGTVTGLTNGTAYKAKIRAANANGNGEYSSLTSAFTPDAGGGDSDPLVSIVTQPAAVSSGSAFTSAPKVLLGAAGLTVTATISSGSGTLSNASAVSGSDSTATFSSLTVSILGSTATLRLTFTATGYQSATSSSFVVTRSSGSSGGGSGGGGSGGGGSGGGGSGGGGGGSDDSSSSGSTSTTVPRAITSPATPNTNVPPSTQPASASLTSVKIPKGYGAPVNASTPPAAFATGAAVATKAGSVVAVLDAPNLSGKNRILSYKIVLTPAKGKSISKVIKVPLNGAAVTVILAAPGGTYKMQVSAIRANGKSAGNWNVSKLVVKKP